MTSTFRLRTFDLRQRGARVVDERQRIPPAVRIQREGVSGRLRIGAYKRRHATAGLARMLNQSWTIFLAMPTTRIHGRFAMRIC